MEEEEGGEEEEGEDQGKEGKNTGIHNSQHSQSGKGRTFYTKQAFNNHEMPFKKDFSVFILLADT